MKLVMALFIGKLVELRKKRCYTEIHRMMSQGINGHGQRRIQWKKMFFMTGGKTLTLEDYLQYDAGSRDNLGEELPVMVYRLLEYSLKEELIGQFGKEKQIEIFRNAGRKAGEYFAKKMLNLDQPLDQFVSELQSKMQELKIGVFAYRKGR